MHKYEKTLIGIDPVIFSIRNNKLYVYLKTREKEPFKDLLELPGGLLLPNETAEESLSRKLLEYFNTSNIFFEQFFTFTNPKRDPRERTISIGYVALLNSEIVGNYENWRNINEINSLAFDHEEIITKAKEYLRENLNPFFVKQFLPKEFPLNKVQKVYEILQGKAYDNRNFRKQMLKSQIIIESNKFEQNVSHRPARLYKFNI